MFNIVLFTVNSAAEAMQRYITVITVVQIVFMRVGKLTTTSIYIAVVSVVWC